MRALRTYLAATLLALASAPASAGLQIIGDGITGDVNVANGDTLWSLVSGVQTETPTGYNSHNAILRNYVVAQGAGGAVSLFSVGEINPSFGGTNLAPYISVSGGDYTLVDPNAGAGARGVSDLTSIEVIAVAAAPSTPSSVSKSIALSGKVASPGAYGLLDLVNLPASATTVSGTTFVGVNANTLVDNATVSNILEGFITVTATDGYRVVFSLAEFDPALGGSASSLLAYASSAGNFQSTDGVARVVTPLDNRRGRWISNIDAIEVQAVPEPSTWALLIAGFGGLGLLAVRRHARASAAT